MTKINVVFLVLLWIGAGGLASGAEKSLYLADYPDNVKYKIALRVDNPTGRIVELGIVDMTAKDQGTWVPQTVLYKDGKYSTVWDEYKGKAIGLTQTHVQVTVGKTLKAVIFYGPKVLDLELISRDDFKISGTIHMPSVSAPTTPPEQLK